MGTPLYSTDIKTVPNRPELSALDAGDFYLVYDMSTGKISKISKTNAHAELVASIVANADDIILRENISNKKSTLSENSEVYYPNQKAVNDGLDTKTSKSQIAYYAESTNPAEVGWIPNTLSSGAIIERGYNGNGEYVKFADGTMIAYKTSALLEGDGTIKNFETSFPAPFISIPHVLVTWRIEDNASYGYVYTQSPTTSSTVIVWSQLAERTGYVVLLCVGKWK